MVSSFAWDFKPHRFFRDIVIFVYFFSSTLSSLQSLFSPAKPVKTRQRFRLVLMPDRSYPNFDRFRFSYAVFRRVHTFYLCDVGVAPNSLLLAKIWKTCATRSFYWAAECLEKPEKRFANQKSLMPCTNRCISQFRY